MSRPRWLVVAAAVTGVQAVALTVTGVAVVVGALVGHPHSRGVAVFLGICVLLAALAWLATARGLWRANRWSQTPAYLEQFLALVVVAGQLETLPGYMVPLLVSALVVLAAVTAPSSRAALGGV